MIVPVAARPPRPTGITILTILQIIVGIMDLLIGILLLAVYGLALSLFGLGFSEGFGIFLVPLAIVSFVFGLISFVLAYGLWNGRLWAWVSTVITAIVGLTIGIIGLLFGSLANLIVIVFYALILAYLSTGTVRAFFGRGPMFPVPVPPTPVQAGPPRYAAYPPYPQYPPVAYRPPPVPPAQPAAQPFSIPPAGWSPGSCPTCRSPIQPYANYCDRCGTRVR